MSRSIEDRIVNMQFNNREFEKHAGTTLTTLDKLKKALDFKNVSKGFSNITNSAKNVTLSPIENGISAITNKMSSLELAWSMTLANMITKAIDAGVRMTKALTIEPMKTGFQEYETQMNAIQTIWANTKDKGTSMDQINEALDELNQYADKTIYNFTQMTSNIGRFTASGVDLDTSVKAIKGIANLSAMSGASAQDASRAMYQLSQAMAAGYVKLMDWNSVVNANIGGETFQNVLKQTAREHGIAIDDMIKKAGSFRLTLEQNWLTTDILTESLAKFTDETTELGKTATEAATKVKTFTQLWSTLKESVQSGWSMSWRLIIGDFEDARTSLSALSDGIQKFLQRSSSMRNDALTFWSQNGIFDKELTKKIEENEKKQEELYKIALDVQSGKYGNGAARKNQLTKLYGEEEARKIQDIVNGFYGIATAADEASESTDKVFTGRDMAMEGVKNILSALHDVIISVRLGFEDVFPPITGQKLIELSKSFLEFTKKLSITETHFTDIRKISKGVFSIFHMGFEVVSMLAKAFKSLLDYALPSTESILEYLGSVGDWLEELDDTDDKFDKLQQGITNVSNKIKTFIDFLKKLGTFVKDWIINNFSMEGVDAGPIDTIKEKLVNTKKSLVETFPFLEDLFAIAKSIGNLFTNLIKHIFDGLSVENVTAAIQGGIGVGILKTISNTIKSFSSKGLAQSFGGPFIDTLKSIKSTFSAVTETLGVMQTSIKADIIEKIAKSLLIMAGSLLVISLIDSEKIDSALGGITVMMIELIAALGGMTKIVSGKGVAKFVLLGPVLNSMATAILMLAIALKVVSTIPTDVMLESIAAIEALFAGLTLAMNGLNGIKISPFMASALTGLSVAMVILTISIKSLSKLNWEELGKGLSGVAGGLTAITLSMNGLKNNKHLLSTGISLIFVSIAINKLGDAITTISKLSWEGIGKGLATVVIGLYAMTAIIDKIQPKRMISTGVGLIFITEAIETLTSSMITISTLSWEDLAKGLAGVIVGLYGIVAVANLMKGSIVAAISIAIISGAIETLANTFTKVGAMKWEELGKGFVFLAGSLTVIGVAGYLLGPVVPVIAGLGLALAGLGVGLFAMTAATVLFVGSVELIIMSLPLIKEAVTGLLTSIIESLTKIVPALIDLGLTMFNSILSSLSENLPNILTKLGELLMGIMAWAEEQIPPLIDQGVRMLISIFNGIANALNEHGDELIAAVGNLITAILGLLGKIIPKILDVLKRLLSSIGNGIKDGLNKLKPGLGNVVAEIWDAIGIGRILTLIIDFVSDLFSGFSDGLDSGFAGIKDAFVNLFTGLWDWLKNDSIFAKAIEIGGDLIGKIVNGIKGGWNTVTDAVSGAFDSVLDFLKTPIKAGKNLFDDFIEFGGDLIDNIVEGISNFFSNIGDKIGEIGDNLSDWIEEHNVIDDFIQAGKDFIQGIIDGIKEKGSELIESVGDIAEDALDKFQNFFGIESPSKVMMVQGKYLDEGLAIGIRNSYGTIDKSINTMSDDMYSSLSKTMGDLNDAIYTDIDYEPQIKPVLNLDDVTRNANYLNGMFTNQEIALRQLGASMSTRVSFDEIQNGRYSDQNVLTELRNLRSDITNLNSAMSHMQVVMDSGALVGSIAAPMDSALGRRHIYSRRGV